MTVPARPIRPKQPPQDPQVRHTGAAQGRLTPLRELQLVEAYRKGGAGAHAALTELLAGYQRRIFSICVRMVRNVDDASELTQDSLMKVIEGLSGYDGRAKLSTWVIRIAMNCCLTHLRKQKVREHQSLDAPADQQLSQKKPVASIVPQQRGFSGASGRGLVGSAMPATGEHSPLQRIEQRQQHALVLQALDSLDAETRAILVLRDVQDLDYQQLAQALEIPIGTVKSRLFRARAALRAAIEARPAHGS